MDMGPEARLHKRQLTKARSCPRLIVGVNAIPQIWFDGSSGLPVRLRKIHIVGPVLRDQEQAIRQRHGIERTSFEESNGDFPKFPCNTPCNVCETSANIGCNSNVSNSRIPPVTSQMPHDPTMVASILAGHLQRGTHVFIITVGVSGNTLSSVSGWNDWSQRGTCFSLSKF